MTSVSPSRFSRRTLRWTAPFILGVVLVLSGCDEGSLMPPTPEAGDMFARYAAIGNSITAGFQSDGINANTQRESYAVLMANQMGTEFNIPALNGPGCPPPLVQVIPQPERLAGADASTCALRQKPIPTVLNNVAVPGAAVLDVLTNLLPPSSPNPLTTLFLGGRTQLQAAAEADPTFVSVWIGNNDVLGAALSGNTNLITRTEDFELRYTNMLDSLQALPNIEGGVLIGVADVTLIPHFSPGAAYAQAEQGPTWPSTFEVADNCAGAGAPALVPFTYGIATLLSAARQGQSVTLDCLNDSPVLTPEERAQVSGTIRAYNSFIQQEAESRGWAYVNPNPPLEDLRNAGEIPSSPTSTR